MGHIHHRERMLEIFLKVRVLLLKNIGIPLGLILGVFYDFIQVRDYFSLNKLDLLIDFFFGLSELFVASFDCQILHVSFHVVS